MNALSNAQYNLVDSYIADIAENRGLTPEQTQMLSDIVYRSKDVPNIWNDDVWKPIVSVINECADTFTD